MHNRKKLLQVTLLLAVLQLVTWEGSATPVCFPDQDISECIKMMAGSVQAETSTEVEDEEEVALRSSFINGRGCFSSAGYYGTCRNSRQCKNTNYSYSRACGWSLSCCEQKSSVIPREGSFTTRTRPSVWSSSNIKASFGQSSLSTKASSLPTVSDGDCGNLVDNFVFGGQEAPKGTFPFLVSFVHGIGNGYVENFCGGVLITRRHVLTAAHCFNNLRNSDFTSGKVDVRLGLTDLRDREDYLAKADISSVKIHPQYREKSFGVVNPVNDIAIVTLDREVRSSRVTTICLPRGGRERSQWAMVAGWGKVTQSAKLGSPVQKLKFSYLEEFTPSECQNKYDKLFRGRGSKVIIDQNEMLCAGNEKADACAGDSGSPLIWMEDRRWTVGGVVSFGPTSCGNVVPGGYTRVEAYLSWIRQNIY